MYIYIYIYTHTYIYEYTYLYITHTGDELSSPIDENTWDVKVIAPEGQQADNGKACEYVTMPGDLVQRIVEACAGVLWLEGQAGELEGVVRLLGGGMINKSGST